MDKVVVLSGKSLDEMLLVDVDALSNASDRVLLAILKTQRGQTRENVNDKGLYNNVSFTFHGYDYKCDISDLVLYKRKSGYADMPWKAMKRVVSRQVRSRFNFNGNDAHITTHRLFAALFIPHAAERMLSEADLSVNHKAGFIDGMTSARFASIKRIYDMLKEKRDELKITHPAYNDNTIDTMMREYFASSTGIVTDQAINYIARLSKNFTQSPIFPRYEHPENYELVTPSENSIHYLVMSELIANKDSFQVFALERRMVPAAICVEYNEKRISLEELITYIKSCPLAPAI